MNSDTKKKKKIKMSKCSIKATKETFSEPEKGKTTRTKEKKKVSC